MRLHTLEHDDACGRRQHRQAAVGAVHEDEPVLTGDVAEDAVGDGRPAARLAVQAEEGCDLDRAVVFGDDRRLAEFGECLEQRGGGASARLI
jgi:hypothetical protein